MWEAPWPEGVSESSCPEAEGDVRWTVATDAAAGMEGMGATLWAGVWGGPRDATAVARTTSTHDRMVLGLVFLRLPPLLLRLLRLLLCCGKVGQEVGQVSVF